MKDSINLIKKGLNEIHKFDNKLLLISLISVVSNVCSIMINIFFSSYMISLLENGSLKQILINLLILSIANSLFLLIQKTFEQILDGRKTILLNKERLKINKIFFTIEYQKLENQEFQSLQQKIHRKYQTFRKHIIQIVLSICKHFKRINVNNNISYFLNLYS